MMDNQSLLKLKEVQLLQQGKHVFWMNPNKDERQLANGVITMEEIINAENRLMKFASYIQKKFPITKLTKGVIESDLKDIPSMKKLIEGRRGIEIPGILYMKCDHALPISGSIKARGGIYEVLAFAEQLALDHHLLTENMDYEIFDSEPFRNIFKQYTIVVGSTGNLGLSIGVMSAALGFRVRVHMSEEAKQWKKELLREKGVEVIEHREDYGAAVEAGRKEAELDSNSYFVDDENSKNLFLGYATAVLRLQQQLRDEHIQVDADHPLFIYLPCGVGGGPGGVAYGIKEIFGEHVHIFFGEPMQSPSMLLGMLTGRHDTISVHDIGLTNRTEADGLAVARPSAFVGKIMEPILSGCYTVDDSFLFRSLKAMYEQENIFMEPSAHAAVYGPIALVNEGKKYIELNQLQDKMENSTHIVWSTGGDLVPHQLRQQYLQTEI